jgi:hypothetical protein
LKAAVNRRQWVWYWLCWQLSENVNEDSRSEMKYKI